LGYYFPDNIIGYLIVNKIEEHENYT